ncbi:hypothetical protein VA599_00530 [Chromobacterium sp. TRC.1.1.SA]|uniref:DUF222 domain-containing protein n=1 Tax=Chromobacterium indicum TaxID=3110228 RepID=A0ABV0CGV8_9NEIS
MQLLAHIDAQAAELAEWHKLRDSNALHINLLRGMPARLTTEQLLHIAGDEYQRMAARITELERERDHWKANHDNQVQRARILVERPDMPLERVRAFERYAELERDAARYRWLTQDAHIGECFTDRGVVLEICGTDREIPVLHERATDRDEVDAAIDAAMEQSQPTSSGCRD